MADFEKTIAIIFEGDDRVGKTISGISSGLDDLGSRVQTATQPFADLAENALKLEAAFAALVAGGLAYAVKSAGEFSDSFNEISTLFSATPEKVNAFKSDIVDYSKTSSKSIEDINASVYSAISAGVQYTDAIGALSQAERLSIAGKADLNATTILLASTLNAYGASTDQAQRYSDAFFQTVKLGQTTLPELAANMAQITPLASNMKVPIETITAAIAALTAKGTPTSEAITQIRSALVGLSAPSSQAAELAGELGLKIGATEIASRGFDTVLKDVYETTGGNVDQIKKLVGRVEGLNAVLVLGGDQTGKFADDLKAMQDSAGSTQEAFDKMSQNMSLVFQNLKNNLQAVLIDIGTPLLDESIDIMQGLSQVFQSVSFSFNSGAFDPIFDLIQNFGSMLAVDIQKIAENLPAAFENVDFGGLLKSIEGLGEEVKGLFEAFFGSIDIRTPEGLAAAIQKVVNSGTALTNIVSGILDAWQPFIAQLSAGIDKFSESDAEVQKLVGQFLGWAQVINTVADNMGILTGALTAIGVGINLMAVTRIPAMISSLAGLGSAIGTGGAASIGLLGPLTLLVGLLGTLVALTPNTAIGDWARENIPIFSQFADAVDRIVLRLGGFDVAALDAAEAQAAHTKAMGDAAVAAVKLIEQLNEVPNEKTTEVLVKGSPEYQAKLEEILAQIEAVPDSKDTIVSAQVDEQSFKNVEKYLIEELPDGTVQISANTNTPSFIAAKDEIAKIPSKKEIELKAKNEVEIELKKIEEGAAVVQTALEWKAKIDIAEIEQVFETIRQISGDITKMFESSGDVILGLADALQGASASEYLDILNLLSKEEGTRKELAIKELELAQKQIDYLSAKQQRLQSGQALVTINGEGLTAELQLVLERIIELTQTTATEQGLEFLIGI
jgi:TP901 family phage tail tape measure protein